MNGFIMLQAEKFLSTINYDGLLLKNLLRGVTQSSLLPLGLRNGVTVMRVSDFSNAIRHKSISLMQLSDRNRIL